MTSIESGQRGVVSGLLNLSRNLGLITGASVMGAVFALGSASTDIAAARPARCISCRDGVPDANSARPITGNDRRFVAT